MTLTYEQFLLRESLKEANDAKLDFLLSVVERKVSKEEVNLLKFFLNEGYSEELLDIVTSINEASFIEKFKDLASKAKEKIQQGGKGAADKIADSTKLAIKFGGNLLTALKSVLAKIKDALSQMVKYALEKAKEAADASFEKIKEELGSYLKSEESKHNLIKEVKNLQEVGKASINFISGSFVKSAVLSAEKAAKLEESYEKFLDSSFYKTSATLIREGYSLEMLENELTMFESHGSLKIPFVSAVLDRLSKVPPFSLFHKAEEEVAKIAEKGLNAFSKLATKLANAPGPYDFPIMAGIVGVIAGYMLESEFKNGMKAIQEKLISSVGIAIPGYSIVYNFLKYGGMALTAYGVVNQLLRKEETEQ